MAACNIFLGNPGGAIYAWRDLVFAVQALFKPVIVGMPQFDSVFVRSTMSPPALGPTELLVYVMRSSSDTIVSGCFHATHKSISDGGLTAWDGTGLTASEVYINGRDPKDVENLIFHEALHNKLHFSDKQLHSSHGLAGDPVSPPQTPHDIQLMRRGLPRAVPQWIGGWDAFSDPLRGVLP